MNLHWSSGVFHHGYSCSLELSRIIPHDLEVHMSSSLALRVSRLLVSIQKMIAGNGCKVFGSFSAENSIVGLCEKQQKLLLSHMRKLKQPTTKSFSTSCVFMFLRVYDLSTFCVWRGQTEGGKVKVQSGGGGCATVAVLLYWANNLPLRWLDKPEMKAPFLGIIIALVSFHPDKAKDAHMMHVLAASQWKHWSAYLHTLFTCSL